MSEAQILEASDWFQLRLIAVARSPALLDFLVINGRTKRIRDAASSRLPFES